MRKTTFSSFSFKFLATLSMIAVALAGTPAQPVYAATLTVDRTDDTAAATACTAAANDCSLRGAISNANAAAGADTIVLTSGSTYVLSLTAGATGDLDITSEITIQADAAGVAIIDPDTTTFNDRVFDVALGASLTLDTIRITTANAATQGVTIRNAGTLTVQDNSEITSNTATGGANNGAGINSSGTLFVSNTMFTGNSTGNNGGAIFVNGGTATISSSTFTSNTAAGFGGAIYINNGTVSVSDSTFTTNSSNGGAIYHSTATLLTITNSTFTSNSSTSRGGAVNIAANTASASISGSTFSSNTATDDGGAISNAGALTLQNDTFYGNASGLGATNLGGAVFSNGGTLNISFVSFSNNRTSAGNGSDVHAIDNGVSALNLYRSFLVNPVNSTVDCFSAMDTDTVTNSLVEGNAAGANACGTAVSTPFADTFTLANNGGSTQTLAITTAMTGLYNAATACTNASGATVSTDQRGTARPQGTNCDLGAFELVANVAPTGGNGSVTTNEDTLYTFTVADFTTLTNPPYSDADGNAFAGIQVTSLETAGTLQCGGVDVPLNGTCADVTTLTFLPAANDNGSPYATFGFKVFDGTDYSTSSYTMTINVNAVNDEPTFLAFNPLAVNEDSGPQTGSSMISTTFMGAANEAGQSVLAFIVSNSTCGTLLSAGPTLDTSGVVSYTPAPDQFGTCTFDLQMQDTGGTANGGDDLSQSQTGLTITVNAVNDAPSFVMGGDQTVLEDAGAQTVVGWATSISAGPANEAGQTLTFNLTNDNNALFSTQPSIAANGTLTYTPAANANGSATVTVTSLQDNGGTANGGVDTFTPIANTFTITVTAVNDAPSFTVIAPPAVNEDAGAQSVNIISTQDMGPNDEDSSQSVLAYLVSNSTCGTLLSAGPAVDTSGILTYTPAANQNGTCTFDLQLQDTGGTANSGIDTSPAQTITITVNAVDDASVAIDDAATVSEDAAATTIDVRGNDTDVDSAVELIQSVSQPTNGVVVNNGTDLTYQPNANYCNNGTLTDDFTYTLTGGSTAKVVITVTCTNDPSIAVDDSATVNEDAAATTISVRGNDTDVDSAVELIQSVTQPTNGVVVNNGTDLTYQPNVNYCNGGTPTDDFTYTLTGGSTATVFITVTCVPDSSIAVDDTATVNEDVAATTISVRGNDTDVDSAVELIQSVTQPTNGVVVNNGTDLTYQPNANYCNDGTPTDDFTYILTGGSTATVTVTVICLPDPPLITSAAPLGGAVGIVYSHTYTATGDTPITYSVTTGALPAGLTLSSAGVISGTPTAGGTFNGTVTATNGVNPDDTQTFSIAINAPTISVSPATLPNGTVASAYSQTITASGGTAPYSFAVTAGALPAGLTLSSSGALSGTPTAGGTFNFTVSATDSSTGTGPYTGSRAYTLIIDVPTITISPATLPNGTITFAYNQTVAASDGTAPYTYAITAGALPNGLSLNPVTGQISGTPTSTGTFNFTVTATDSSTGAGPYTGSRAYSVTIDGNTTVTINQGAGQTDPTSLSPIAFDVVFSASVTGFDGSDVNLSASTAGGTLVANVSGSGATYTVTVTGMTTNGDVIASIPAGAALDSVTSLPTAASTSTDNTVRYDSSVPTVTGSTPANSAIVAPGLTQITVTFSEDMKSGPVPGSATDTANYLLVEDGANGIFDTASCAGGVAVGDTGIAIPSATYLNRVATLTVSPLGVGNYLLFVCGTTSVEDLDGTELNGGASDALIFFTVAVQGGGGGTGGGQTTSSSTLPATGFPMNQVTTLPVQPADKAYSSTDIWLEIPKLKVKMSIVGVPKTDGSWDVTWLGKNAGWLSGSAYPTWNGNSVITGHVWDALNQPGPFAKLKDLKYGDQIKIHAFGNLYTYEIRSSETISPSNSAKVFKHEEKSWLTLITCENYRELTNTYLSRRILKAVLISVSAEK